MHWKHQLQQIWRLHLNKWPQEYQNRIWPTFGCKVGQNVLIAMKLELDLWCHLLDVYSKFEINIWKHVKKKAQKTEKNPKRAKIITKIPKIRFLKKTGTYVGKYTEGYLYTTFERIILIYESMNAKNEFDLFLAVNKVKVTQLWWKSNLTCHATCGMYILSLKIISESMLKKSPENLDGLTDGRTDGHCHGIIRPFFKRAYKKSNINIRPTSYHFDMHFFDQMAFLFSLISCTLF